MPVDPNDPDVIAQIQSYLNFDPSMIKLEGAQIVRPVIHIIHRGRLDGFDFLSSGLKVEIQGSGSAATGFVIEAEQSLGNLLQIKNGTPVFYTIDKDNVWFIHNAVNTPIANPTAGPFFYASKDHLRLKDSAGLTWRIPDGNLDARISGLECWTYDLVNAAQETELVHGTVYMQKVYYPTSGNVTQLAFIRAQNLGGGTITDFRAGLYDISGNRLTQSANFSSSMGTSGFKLVPVTSIALDPNYYFLAFLSVGSGQGPQVAHSGTLGSILNANTTAANFRFAIDGTGVTALPATITMGSRTSTDKTVWAGINQ